MRRKWIPVHKDDKSDLSSLDTEEIMDLKKNPKLLNALIIASNLVQGVYRKPDEDDAKKGEKGTENESNHR